MKFEFRVVTAVTSFCRMIRIKYISGIFTGFQFNFFQ